MDELRNRATPKFAFKFGETIAMADVLHASLPNPREVGEKLQIPLPSLAIGAPGFRGMTEVVKMLMQKTPNVPVRVKLTIHSNNSLSMHLEIKPFDKKTQSFITESPWVLSNPFDLTLAPDRGNQGFHKTRLKAEQSDAFAFYLVDTLTGVHVFTMCHKLHEGESPTFYYLRHMSGMVGSTLGTPIT